MRSSEGIERLKRWADLTGAGIFAVLFLALVVQVVRRFVFGAPSAWTEELATIAFVWVIFWGTAFTVPLSTHVAVDFVARIRGQEKFDRVEDLVATMGDDTEHARTILSAG